MSRSTAERSGSAPAREDDRARDLGTALIAAGGVLVLLLSLYGAAAAVAGDRVASGTRVAGVGIGGLAPSQAAARLRAELGPRAEAPIEVSAAGTETALDPERAGLRLDAPATVDRAGAGDRIDPLAVWDAFFGGDRVAPVVRVDRERLLGALRWLAERTGVAPVEPAVTFEDARPVVQRPRTGSQIDVGRSAAAVLDAWLVDESTVELPLTRTAPSVDADRLRAAMQETVTVLVSDHVKLRFPGRVVPVPAWRYAPALSVRVADGRLRPIVDLLQLSRRLAGVLRVVERPARSASVKRDRCRGPDRLRVIPARDGIQVSPEGLARAVLRAASSSGAVRDAGVARTRITPARSTREVRREVRQERREDRRERRENRRDRREDRRQERRERRERREDRRERREDRRDRNQRNEAGRDGQGRNQRAGNQRAASGRE